MTVTGLEPALERALDLGGVVVFALSGGSLAARKGFDVVGILVLATATGLGGGILRDTLLGDLPPAALRDQLYLGMPLIAAVVVLGAHHLVENVGSAKALDRGLGVLPSVLLGVMTAVGGGVIRDVLAREVPMVFIAENAMYAIPATLGAAATAAMWSNGRLGAAEAIGIAAAVILVRLLAIRHGWSAPTARRRRR
jgi:uncharacterized membrane protein YeiH